MVNYTASCRYFVIRLFIELLARYYVIKLFTNLVVGYSIIKSSVKSL